MVWLGVAVNRTLFRPDFGGMESEIVAHEESTGGNGDGGAGRKIEDRGFDNEYKWCSSLRRGKGCRSAPPPPPRGREVPLED